MQFDIAKLLGRDKVTVLVTAVGGPPGKNAVRALSKFKNFSLVLTDAQEDALTAYQERFVTHVMPSAHDESNYLKSLMDLCLCSNVDVLIPCIETEVILLSKHVEKFKDVGVSIPIPGKDLVGQSIDKYELFKKAQELDIPTIKTLKLDCVQKVKQLEDWTYPIVVKPAIGHGSRGVAVLNSFSELVSWQESEEDFQDFIAQQFIPGGAGSNYMYSAVFSEQGKVKARFCSRSTATLYDYGGPAVAGEPVNDAELFELGKRIESSYTNWFGIANFEFKRHSGTGEYYLMDFNPRIWGYSSLAEDLGFNVPLMLCLLALNVEFSFIGKAFPWGHMERDSVSLSDETKLLEKWQLNPSQRNTEALKVFIDYNTDNSVATLSSIAADEIIVWSPKYEMVSSTNNRLFLPLLDHFSQHEIKYFSLLLSAALQFNFRYSNAESIACSADQIIYDFWKHHE